MDINSLEFTNHKIETTLFLYELVTVVLDYTMFTLHPHQAFGVKYLMAREPNDFSKTKLFGSILADEMGLGKTIQTISLITRSPLITTLLCCPSTLCGMWVSQINKFAPDVQVFVFREKNTLSSIFKQINHDKKKKSIVICSYGITFRRPELYDFTFDRIVCDEAHLFRNSKSKVFNGMLQLKATTKLLLTGTPIQNKIGDLVSLINFIIGVKMKLNIDFVKKFIKERMLRRKIADVGIQMPKLSINQIEVVSKTSNKNAINLTREFMYNYALEKIIRQKQASVFPESLAKNFFKTYDISPIHFSNEKSDIVIENIINRNENCIVFTEFVDELKYIKKQLQEKAPTKKIESISGSTPLDERNRIATDTSINILVIQINTASIGLNLQHFSVAHFTNIQWNPSNTEQAIGRINRIGQTTDMQVFIYSFQDSIDKRIAFIAQKKKEFIISILEKKKKYKIKK